MSTSAAKARAKREAAKAAAVDVTTRQLTPEEMELLGVEPGTQPTDDSAEGDDTEGDDTEDDSTEGDSTEGDDTEGPSELSALWRGGRGVKQYYVVANTEEEAIAKLIEKDSILGAIGCTAELIENIDGYTILAVK